MKRVSWSGAIARRMSTERLVDGERPELVLARLEATGARTVSCYSSRYDSEFPDTLDGISTCIKA